MKVNHTDYDDPLKAYEYWLSTMKEVRSNRVLCSLDDTLKESSKLPMPTEYSDEFLGVYVFGGHKEFKLEDHEAAFASFRKYSEKFYPLYFFYADWECRGLNDGFNEIVLRYGPMKVIEINPITDITDYSKFMIWDLWKHIPEENEKILTFQNDGYLVNSGWEPFINEHDPDYIGSYYTDYTPEGWKDILYIKDVEKYNVNQPPDFLMNGGFSFRKRSKMIQISNLISKDDIDYGKIESDALDQYNKSRTSLELYTPPRLNEDMAFCYLGFGKNIFKPVPEKVANKFSSCSYNVDIDSFGFHGYGF
ncbi:MAG: hypothetical protein H8E05_01080 [Bacteroidetes bacterium]|nr:hypothetical protein [Bacteroidota bacterium]